jgi:hypothetical protein
MTIVNKMKEAVRRLSAHLSGRDPFADRDPYDQFTRRKGHIVIIPMG